MRVLHVTDRLSERGGADWHLRCVLRALAEAGVDVQLAVGRRDAATRAVCPVECIDGLDAPRAAGGATLGALARLVQRLAPDRIHVHNALSPEILRYVAHLGGVATVQDHRSFCPGRGKWTAAGEVCRTTLSQDLCMGCFVDPTYAEQRYTTTRARLEALVGMRTVVVLSGYMRDELCAAGLAPARVRVIPPFVEAWPAREARHAGDDAPCILVCGRVVDAKGIDDAVAVWRASEVSLPLVFAGTGSARAGIEAAGASVLGWVPHDQLAAVYRRARVLLLLPRWQEPFGIVGLEAASLGVPVVAWTSGGIPEWLPTAQEVAWGDRAAAARALRAAVNDPRPPAIPQNSRTEATRRLLEVYADAAGTA